MRLFGKTNIGESPVELASDRKRVARFTCTIDGIIPKLTLYCDGQGSGVGNTVARGIIYATDNSLLGQSGEVPVAQGAAGAWRDFPFPAAAYPGVLAGVDYDLGVHVGGGVNVLRVFQTTPDGLGSKRNDDVYANGAANPFGGAEALAGRFSVFATVVPQWVPPTPTEVDDFFFGRLSWNRTQQIFATGGPLPAPRYRTFVGWHGTFIDDERVAFAIVRAGGPLAGLLGQRLKITKLDERGAPIYVYCHNEADTVEDITVSRRAYLALAPLATGNVRAIVEVMGA